METSDYLLAAFGICLGGFLKGATGAGAPVIGVPILAMIFGVQKAVAIFSVINLFSNAWQSWSYRSAITNFRFVWTFALAGAAGAFTGSLLLAWLPTEVLMGTLAGVVFFYIALRLMRPDWQLQRAKGEGLAGAIGYAGGMMQGAGGISAPISVTYLNAMRLERSEFVATISVFFVMMSVFQVPALATLGILTWERFGLALVAMIPMFVAMPLGAAAAKRVSKETFDKLILAMLAVVATRLLYTAVV